MSVNDSYYKEFPTLAALDLKLKNDVNQLKSKMKEVEEHPRYKNNEAERQYQLEKLQTEYEETLAKAEDDFQIELEALELQLAEQAFELPSGTAEEVEKAQALASVITTQLVTSTNIKDTLSLLKTRVKTMSDLEKQAVKMALTSMFDVEGMDEIMQELNDTEHMNEINEQLDALKRIKAGGDSLRRKYDALDYALKNLSKGVYK